MSRGKTEKGKDETYKKKTKQNFSMDTVSKVKVIVIETKVIHALSSSQSFSYDCIINNWLRVH